MFGSPSSVNLLAYPGFHLYLIFIAHYMNIYLKWVQIFVIACIIENLNFSEFLDAMRTCCRQGKHALHKIKSAMGGGMLLSPPPLMNYSTRLLNMVIIITYSLIAQNTPQLLHAENWWIICES